MQSFVRDLSSAPLPTACRPGSAQILGDISLSVKTVPTSLSFVDIAGLVAGASKGEGLGNKFLSNIRE